MPRTLLSLAAVALAAAVLFLIPVEVPSSVSVPGKVYPVREWMLIRDTDGMGAVLRDFREGSVRSYDVTRFERGDAVRFALREDLRLNSLVDVGDTIGAIYSNETQRQIAELTGALATATSSLALYASGEKASVVDQARGRLARAQEQVRHYGNEVERLRKLRERQLVSQQELDVAVNLLEIALRDAEIATAEVEEAQTGAKPEQIDLTRAEAEAIRRQIQTLHERLDRYTIRSPIAGRASRSFGSDTLLTVRDNSSYVIIMPIPWNRYGFVERGDPVRVSVHGLPDAVEGRIDEFSDAMLDLNGQQVLMTTALVSGGTPIVAGILADCTIKTGNVTLLEYLRRALFS